MKKLLFAMVMTCVGLGISAAEVSAQQNPMVGGAAMYRSKNIVENALNSQDHTTLVAAVKAAGLVETLMGKGPFTVFAPVNSAFDKLPAGTVETLLKPENKDTLTQILTYHVVAGKWDAKSIAKAIKKGGTSTVTIADVMQSNGVIHVVDSVLLPGEKMMSGGTKKTM